MGRTPARSARELMARIAWELRDQRMAIVTLARGDEAIRDSPQMLIPDDCIQNGQRERSRPRTELQRQFLFTSGVLQS